MEMFARNMGVKVIRSDCEDLFLGKLAGVADPEKKRSGSRTGRRAFDEVAAWDRWPQDGDIHNPFEDAS